MDFYAAEFLGVGCPGRGGFGEVDSILACRISTAWNFCGGGCPWRGNLGVVDVHGVEILG